MLPKHTSWLESLIDFESWRGARIPFFSGSSRRPPIQGRADLVQADVFTIRATRFGWLLKRVFDSVTFDLDFVAKCDSLRALGLPQSSGIIKRAKRVSTGTIGVLRSTIAGTHLDGLVPP